MADEIGNAPFTAVAVLLNQLACNKRPDILFDKFFSLFRDFKDLHLLLKLVCPLQDKSRKYGIQEKSLVCLLVRVFNWGKYKSEQLELYKELNSKTIGDFGSTLERLVEYPTITFSHSVSKTCDLLNELSLTSKWTTEVGEKPREQLEIISELFLNQEPQNCKWLARIILKNMNPLCMDFDKIIRSIHPCFPPFYYMYQFYNKAI
jgi:hypothetical protein